MTVPHIPHIPMTAKTSIMEKTKTVYCKGRKEWRSCLQENHQSEKGVWLIYYKRHTGKSSITYNDAVEEAICFGWIDGQIKKIDDERYIPHSGKVFRRPLFLEGFGVSPNYCSRI